MKKWKAGMLALGVGAAALSGGCKDAKEASRGGAIPQAQEEIDTNSKLFQNDGGASGGNRQRGNSAQADSNDGGASGKDRPRGNSYNL